MHRQQLRRRWLRESSDIFSLYGGEELVPYAAAGRLLDLTALLESNSLTDKFYDLQAWQFEGSVYGLPLEGMAEPVFYNKRLFARLGISIPENEAQLEKALRKMRAEGVIPFAIGNRSAGRAPCTFNIFAELCGRSGTERGLASRTALFR